MSWVVEAPYRELVEIVTRVKAIPVRLRKWSTLPKTMRDIRGFDVAIDFQGLIKSGIIGDQELFEYCEARMESILDREPKTLLRIIAASATLKAEVVARDEREGGLRRILNFGHTVGHALEAESGYSRFLHGEAVGWGMIAASNIGVACGVTPAKVAERITRVIQSVGPLPTVSANPAEIVKLVQGDKKTMAGVPHFVLARKIGKVEIINKVTAVQIESAVSQLRERSAASGH